MLKKILDKIKKIPRKWLIIAGVVLIAPLVLEITGVFATGTWRYKMTVVVETPEGLVEGSAVRQVSNWSMVRLINWPGAGNPPKFKGEAVVVDLGERGLLFAILGIDPYREFYNAYPSPQGAATVRGIAYYNQMLWGRKKVTLEPESYPKIVMFTDLNDPKSVTLAKGWRFDPKTQKHLPEDNLEELFGQGVTVKDVFIEKTRERVTWKVEEILPWLSNVTANIDGTSVTFSNDLSNSLDLGDFKKEK